jgi:hypothetical protein
VIVVGVSLYYYVTIDGELLLCDDEKDAMVLGLA